MNPQAKPITETASLRRNRRIHDMAADEAIWRAFARYVFLTVDQLMRLLDLKIDHAQNRLRVFYHAGLLNRTQDGPFGPMMYFLSFKGGEKCVNLGILEKPRYVYKKSPKSILHDCQITEFHLALELALRGTRLFWEQWRDDMTDLKHLIPDARFAVDGDGEYTIVEVVRANISKPKDREDELTEKLRDYLKLRIGRILILMPTKLRADNYLKKLSAILPESAIWVTDYDSWNRDVLGKIFRTPKNYETRQYSLLKPKA